MPQLASSQDVIDQVIIRLVEFQRQQQRQEAEQTKQGRKMFNLDDMSLSRASVSLVSALSRCRSCVYGTAVVGSTSAQDLNADHVGTLQPLSMDAETPIGLEDELAGRVETKLSIAS